MAGSNNIINSPPQGAVDTMRKGQIAEPSDGWRNFFNAVFNVCNAMTMSGTTAQRPATLLWTGRMYFDTTLGIPIWFKTVGWVDATGAPA